MYRSIIFPLLRRLDPEDAHDFALKALSRAQSSRRGRAFLKWIAGEKPSDPVTIAGIRFPNRLGIAAGFDKNAMVAPALALLGFGHVEVGTITPRPQKGNDTPRVFRLTEDRALINRMGFPNDGAQAVASRLRKLSTAPRRRDWVLGASLGKQKETPLEDAARDYIEVMDAVYPFADYIAANISSPNTPGLRALQGWEHVNALCEGLVSARHRLAALHGVRRPVFIKIAPDISAVDLDAILLAIENHGIDGIIATNTTIRRARLKSINHLEDGGLSGRPLRRRSTAIIRYIARATGGKLPIIGAGGVFNARDAREKLDAGASLVQVYTGFVYEGPAMAGRMARGIRQ